MPVRKAQAQREGRLRDGKGTMKLGSGAFEGVEITLQATLVR